MLSVLPVFYEDELFYSWLARCYAVSGYEAYSYILEDVFGSTRCFDVRFTGNIREDAWKTIRWFISPEELVLNHTMFPLLRFQSPEKLNKAYRGFMGQKETISVLDGAGQKIHCLRYCPMCAKEDRERYGETYWHRSAQIPNIIICSKHKCDLIETNIRVTGRRAPRLAPAETEIDLNVMAGSTGMEKRNVQLSDFMAAVFTSPVNFDNRVVISDYLKSRLEGTAYLSTGGRKRYIQKLFDDYSKFYEDMGTPTMTELHQLQKCFMGYRTDFFSICQLAFFLGISPEELAHPVLPEHTQAECFEEHVNQLFEKGLSHREVAVAVGASPAEVRQIRKRKERKPYNHSGRRGIRREDWTEMERKMLTPVEAACKEVYGVGIERPHRVTKKTIERILKLPERRLDYLPLCLQQVKRYEETQEEYWAREVVWAYRVLHSVEGKMTVTKIVRRTNLRRKNIDACMRFLDRYATEEEAEAIRILLQD